VQAHRNAFHIYALAKCKYVNLEAKEIANRWIQRLYSKNIEITAEAAKIAEAQNCGPPVSSGSNLVIRRTEHEVKNASS
jgi:hypothetical protein